MRYDVRAGVAYNLGVFTTEIEAALAYDRAARQLHSDHAVTNFSPEGTETQAITLRRALVEHCSRDAHREHNSSGSERSVHTSVSSAPKPTPATLAQQCVSTPVPYVQQRAAFPPPSRHDYDRADSVAARPGASVCPPPFPDYGLEASSSSHQAASNQQRRIWGDSSGIASAGDLTQLREYIAHLQQQLEILSELSARSGGTTEEMNDEYVSLVIRLDDAVAHAEAIANPQRELATTRAAAKRS